MSSLALFQVGVLASRPNSVVLIYDEFTAADGTTQAGRAPSPTNTPGNTYFAAHGGGTTTSNKATYSGSPSCILINSGQANGRVSAVLVHGSTVTRNPRLFFRSNGTVAGLAN